MNGNGNTHHTHYPTATASGSSSYSRGHDQGQGKYMIRLRRLEEENVRLNSKIGSLEKWKERMEEWMADEFGVTINAEFDRSEGEGSETTALVSDNDSVSDDHNRPSTPSNIVVLKVESLSPHRNSEYSNFELMGGEEVKVSDFDECDDSCDSDSNPNFEATPAAQNGAGISFQQQPSDLATPSTSKQNHKTSAGNSNGGGSPPHPTTPEDDIPCAVCGSPDSEENNEMVFCEGTGCTICVHQACYGIPIIPDGRWECQTCSAGIAPGTEPCLFCPAFGGAMTRCVTPSNQQWAHVSCSWWISEVNFDNPVLMKTVIGIPRIPKSRWKLRCIICRIKKGACIQCSFGRCTEAFHVTCAHKYGLKMEIFDVDVNARKNGVPDSNTLMMKAYCKAHTNCEPPAPKKRQLSGKSPQGRKKKSV